MSCVYVGLRAQARNDFIQPSNDMGYTDYTDKCGSMYISVNPRRKYLDSLRSDGD
jgi:hypothetical protein